MLEARILGPLELSADGCPVVVPGAKARRVLALLLLSRGRWVSTDRLMDELWGAQLPASGRKALQMHVARLREAMTEVARDAGDLVRADSGGYRLGIAAECLDVVRFEQLVDDGR